MDLHPLRSEGFVITKLEYILKLNSSRRRKREGEGETRERNLKNGKVYELDTLFATRKASSRSDCCTTE